MGSEGILSLKITIPHEGSTLVSSLGPMDQPCYISPGSPYPLAVRSSEADPGYLNNYARPLSFSLTVRLCHSLDTDKC